jgi:hypothetical protein
MKIDRHYETLGKAISEASSIPPCMNSDPDAWFVNTSQGRSREVVNVKKLCGSCPVQKECLAYALANPELVGIWGGLTSRERSRLRSKK